MKTEVEEVFYLDGVEVARRKAARNVYTDERGPHIRVQLEGRSTKKYLTSVEPAVIESHGKTVANLDMNELSRRIAAARGGG